MSSGSKAQTQLPDSLWAAGAPPAASFPTLEGEQSADVCVVGGGYTGLSTALHAAEAGSQVVLVEGAEAGWGAAGRNGGQVIPGLKLDPEDLERHYGADRGQRLTAFSGSAPDLVFDLIARHQIDCSARRDGWIRAVHAPAALRSESERVRQWQARGVDLRLLDREEVAVALGTSEYIAGTFDPRGGWLQPLAYARGLALAAQRAGTQLFAASPATRIWQDRDKWRVESPAGSVLAGQVVICTNAYTDTLWPRLGRSLVPISSYQVATEPLSEEVRARILPKGQVASDTRRLIRYFSIDPQGRLTMGGRGRLREVENRHLYRHIVASLQRLFPYLSDARLDFYWSGRIALTLDHLPRVFELGPGLWAGGGYNGRGVAMATAMGSLLAQYVGGASADRLPLPPVKPRGIPFHGLRGIGIELAVAWKGMLDTWETLRR